MNILDAIINAQNGAAVQQLGSQVGLVPDQTTAALSALVPALAAGVQRNIQNEAGLQNLIAALSTGNHGQYLDNPASLGDQSAVADGNGILGHLLGSKDVSRGVAGRGGTDGTERGRAQANAAAGGGADDGRVLETIGRSARTQRRPRHRRRHRRHADAAAGSEPRRLDHGRCDVDDRALRQTIVAAARRYVASSTLSLAEIACLVGYFRNGRHADERDDTVVGTARGRG